MNSSSTFFMPAIPKPSGFVIVDSQTGLYSSGGTCPKFRKTPKIWNKINHARSHLSMFVGERHQLYDQNGKMKTVKRLLDVWNPYAEIGRYYILDISTDQTEDICRYFSKKLHEKVDKMEKIIKNNPQSTLDYEASDIAKAVMRMFPQ